MKSFGIGALRVHVFKFAHKGVHKVQDLFIQKISVMEKWGLIGIDQLLNTVSQKLNLILQLLYYPDVRPKQNANQCCFTLCYAGYIVIIFYKIRLGREFSRHHITHFCYKRLVCLSITSCLIRQWFIISKPSKYQERD